MKVFAALFLLTGCEPSRVSAGAHGSASGVETSVKKLLEDSLAENDETIRVNTAFSDLDGDGNDEAIAYVPGQRTCGSGGCPVYILRNSSGTFTLVTKLSISRPPIRVLDSKSNGWHDISVRVQGGGVNPGYEAHLRFDGKSYPSNPSGAPRLGVASGKVVISSSTPATPLYR